MKGDAMVGVGESRWFELGWRAVEERFGSVDPACNGRDVVDQAVNHVEVRHMKNLRKLHLYLGCIFAPILVLFAATGTLQIFGIKIPILFEAHTRGSDSLPLILFSALAGVSVIVTCIVGVLMAFRSGNDRRTVWACLLFGTLVPAALLTVAYFKK